MDREYCQQWEVLTCQCNANPLRRGSLTQASQMLWRRLPDGSSVPRGLAAAYLELHGPEDFLLTTRLPSAWVAQWMLRGRPEGGLVKLKSPMTSSSSTNTCCCLQEAKQQLLTSTCHPPTQ